ncbi:MAG: alpha/beta fold hydrolase [Myxococcaceae bacterium]|nr:alpha/beta fold hydrolase [Myxococcaceae bacterium]
MTDAPPRFSPTAPFVPMAGVGGHHAQTIVAALVRRPTPPPGHRERWETPDGDFLDVDWLPADRRAPHLVVLHGLEGSSRAGYVLETLRGAARRRFGAVALNFRSCSGEPNRFVRAYNSGDTTDVRFAIARMRDAGVTGPIFGVGFSLGASVLLNLLAQTGTGCPLAGGVAISTPFDLSSCATAMDQARGLTALYRRLFLRSLKRKALAQCARLPHALDPSKIRRAKGIRAFDDAVTAPLFGFLDAEAYYRACSAGPKLREIRRPTLLLSAEDDPLAPAAALPDDVLDNPWLSVVRTARGGHVGFLSGVPLRPRFWAEEQALAFIDSLLSRR